MLKTLEKSCIFALKILEKSCKIMLKRKIINELQEWSKLEHKKGYILVN